jgi:hypothetical protein
VNSYTVIALKRSGDPRSKIQFHVYANSVSEAREKAKALYPEGRIISVV